jgi:ABC-type transport system involved in cytochrome c biogenesis permease subunit
MNHASMLPASNKRALRPIHRIRDRLFVLIMLAWGAALSLASAEDEPADFPLPTFAEDTISLFSAIPVQEGGRVKPMGTVARYALLPLSGRTSLTVGIDPEGDIRTLLKGKRGFEGQTHRYSANEWLLLCLLHPEAAHRIPVFIVDDSDAIVRIGGNPKRKRDIYSYLELAPFQKSLVEETGKAMAMEDRARNRIDTMVMGLGQNVLAYQQLTAFLTFARNGITLGTEDIPEFFNVDDDGRLPVSAFLQTLPKLREDAAETSPAYLEQATVTIERYLGRTDSESIARSRSDALLGKWDDVLGRIRPVAGLASAIQMFPPPPVTGEGLAPQGNLEWFTPSNAILTGLLFENNRPWAIERLKLLEAVEAAKTDAASLHAALSELNAQIRDEGAARGEISQIDREVSLYAGRYLNKALAWFLIGFVVVGSTWLLPGSQTSRLLGWVSVAAVVAALAYLCIGIGQRCLIRQRPPITNLYETILFITACTVVLSLFMEWINRQRIALSTAAVLGAAGMFLAIRFEVSEATDTMPTLIAVLRSNFWLWTHVTVITLGYACGLLAAGLSHIYIVGRAFRLADPQGDFLKSVTRMVYGTICFCLLTSLIGTVLGGIWANYSWGRFWGWDPKENGALMIVLGSAIILHARLGGYFRDLGVHMASILLGIIISFSWWGVNNLGIGLHSYGFTSGVWRNLFTAWAIEGIFLFLGITTWLGSRRKLKPAAP